MNDLELDSIAEGLFKYIQEQTANPLDGIAIIGFTLLKVYDCGTDGTITIERFADDFKRSMIESYKARSARGSETRQ